MLNIIDGFLRHANGIADQLANYLHTTGHDQPQPPDWAAYNANLLIDQVSFTAHHLRAHRRKPALPTWWGSGVTDSDRVGD